MSIISGANAVTGAGAVSYQIERSLRFNSADSAYLSRSQLAGNRRTWTYSFWTKLATAGYSTFCDAGPTPNTNYHTQFYISSTGNLTLYFYPNTTAALLVTTQVFRDVSAWYHIVLAVDTTQATSSNRIKIYVNGTQITAFSTATYPSQNFDTYLNDSSSYQWLGQYIGGGYGTGTAMNGYITEYYLIDGQALDPTNFGEYNSDTGVWQPIEYTGTYGTNGCYLNFSDNSGTTSTTLGKDYSGNGNNFTPNNFSVTAGAGNDSLVDTPTPYGTDTGAGGEVRGNYCTFNPNLYNAGSVSYSNGNLLMTMTGNADRYNLGTMAVSSGKWYWEFTPNGFVNSSDVTFGICKASRVANGPWTAYGGPDTINFNTGNGWSVYGSNVGGATGSIAGNDVIGIALDMDSNYIYIYKNGTLLTSRSGSITTSVPHTLFIDTYASGSTTYLNTGQRPFAYAAPSGYKALCTQNLPEPTVVDGGEYFNAVLWTGNGSTQTITTGIANDLVWTKDRGAAYDHTLFDVIRTPGYFLRSNATSAEEYRADSLTAFTSTGFSVGADSVRQNINKSGNSYVSWAWKAGGTGVTNTAGTITSTVSANTTAGFSIVTYTSPNLTADQTVGHGLGVTPALIICKNRVTTYNWDIWHKDLASGYGLTFTTAASTAGRWPTTAPTLTVFSTKNTYEHNGTDTYVAYCFAPVEGYSAFGSYTGNGSTDGPFVYTGFRPAYVLIKASSIAGENWYVVDATRSPYNAAILYLSPNSSGAESSPGAAQFFDFLSNGFKLRVSGSYSNSSGATYIYAAFAENPFKYALAR